MKKGKKTMFSESNDPADHKEHDPSRCDFARIWLTQQYVAGTHVEHVAKLSNEQIVKVGFASALFSTIPVVSELLAEFNLTLQNLYDFSEYLRNYLLVERGFDAKSASLTLTQPYGDPNLN